MLFRETQAFATKFEKCHKWFYHFLLYFDIFACDRFLVDVPLSLMPLTYTVARRTSSVATHATSSAATSAAMHPSGNKSFLIFVAPLAATPAPLLHKCNKQSKHLCGNHSAWARAAMTSNHLPEVIRVWQFFPAF